MLRELRKSESGVTTIEFGLIAALVAVVAIPALVAVGDELQNPFSTASSTISGEVVAGEPDPWGQPVAESEPSDIGQPVVLVEPLAPIESVEVQPIQ